MTEWHLAQLNIAISRTALDDPDMADFYAVLDDINTLGEKSPGFVWRWTEETPCWLDRRLLVNLTVWRDVESLTDFTYRTAHGQVFKRRKQWFDPLPSNHLVLWWVPAGHRPDLPEAFDRLTRLDLDGPTPKAFGFKSPYPPPVAPA